MALKDYRGKSSSSRSRLSSGPTGGAVSRRSRAGYGTKANWFALAKQVRDRNTIPGYGVICGICGTPIEPGEPCETHHVRALTRNGSSESVNLTIVHQRCHDSRHTHLPKARSDRANQEPQQPEFRRRLNAQKKYWK